MVPSQDSSEHQDDIAFLGSRIPTTKPLFATIASWEGATPELYITLPSLKLTAKAPETGWLEYDPASFWDGLFSGAMLVSGMVQ